MALQSLTWKIAWANKQNVCTEGSQVKSYAVLYQVVQATEFI